MEPLLGPRRASPSSQSRHCSTPPPTCPAANAAVTSSSSIMVTGTTAKVTFTVAAGCKDIELTLVSYKAPGPTFDEQTADQQMLFDHKTQLFSAGNWQLDVAVPDCYYQVDFVYGKHIEKLGPAGIEQLLLQAGPADPQRRTAAPRACTTSRRRRLPPTPPPTVTPTPPPVVDPPRRHPAAGGLACEDGAGRQHGRIRPRPGPRQGRPARLLPPDRHEHGHRQRSAPP